jgi:4-amino-4-deoxy-L-arabinose transferase-like glycosyltransferase
MSSITKLRNSTPWLLRVAFILIFLFGIILRFVLYFQNRNLIIDEANIVRNLAERGFLALTQPLSYEQYAPPVFLWIEKLSSILFGYSEYAMRGFPLLCGIAALYVFYRIGSKLMSQTALLAPFALFAFGNMYVKFSTELKQYMPDTLVALILVWAALCWDFQSLKKKTFVLRWALLGSFAIWMSMPSVFILAGIGCYYAWPLLREKKLRQIGPLVAVAAVWLLQFALYYLVILRTQIGSDYLQNYHRPYFLYATPANQEEWMHNWTRFTELLGNVGGFDKKAMLLNGLFMVLGAVLLLIRKTRNFFLIAFPVMLVFIAAALKQFSLIERVVLFMMPLWLLLIGCGLDLLVQKKLGATTILIGAFLVWSYNAFWLFHEKLGFHEITEGMAWIRARGAKGSELYVHDANVPTYIYYTELHPKRAQWSSLFGAHKLKWSDDYKEITAPIKDTAYFLYTGGFPEGEKNKRTAEIETHMRQVGYFEKYICYVYVYVPKADSGASSGTTPN